MGQTVTPKVYTPREYQGMGINHILDLPRCGLHAGTGTGKTSMVLTAADILLLAGESKCILALGPLRVARDVWTDEAAKWEHTGHLRISRILGSEPQRKAALRVKADIYVTNYEQLPWLIKYLGDSWPFDTVIADEATKLKGFRGSVQQSKAGKRFIRVDTGQRTGSLARVAHSRVRRFVELTGTPAPNGTKDLWGQLWFLDAGQRLGRTYTSFEERWFQRSRDGYGIEPLPHAFDEVSGAIKDLCLSVQAKDYFDLNEPLITDIEVTLPDKAMRQYKEMEQELFLEIERTGYVEAISAGSKWLKCLQLAGGSVFLNKQEGAWAEIHKAKIEALESIVEEASGAPVIVAYNFTHEKERLLKHFKGAVDLATTKGLAEFKAGRVAVGVGHPDSIGHGIEGLQYACNIIVFFGLNPNLETREQIIERIGPTRQYQAGLDRVVFIYNLVAKGTVDELILDRVATKATLQQLLLERTKRRK